MRTDDLLRSADFLQTSTYLLFEKIYITIILHIASFTNTFSFENSIGPLQAEMEFLQDEQNIKEMHKSNIKQRMILKSKK